MRTPARFMGVHMEYAPEVPPNREYSPDREGRFKEYVSAIVLPKELDRLLHPDFLHIDGALVLGRDPAEVRHIAVTRGKEPFITVFRDMVSRVAIPDGQIKGVWIPPEDYQPIEAQVAGQLPEGATPQGDLIAAGAVLFPYRLNPDGDPLGLPPPFRSLLREGEEPFPPLVATGDPELDHHDVHVIQAVYGTEKLITARIGLVWNDARAVPFAVFRQTQVRRAGHEYNSAPPIAVARALAQQR